MVYKDYFSPQCKVFTVTYNELVCNSNYRGSSVKDVFEEDDTPVIWIY